MELNDMDVEVKAQTVGTILKEAQEQGIDPEVAIRDAKHVVTSAITEFREVDDEQRVIKHFISTESTDRHGDIVRAKGMDDTNFSKNPVVLYGHDHTGIPVGKSLWRKSVTRNGVKGIMAATQFAPTPEGVMLFELWKDGYLNASSIGFMPKEVEPIRGKAGENGYEPIIGFDFKKWELLEYSIVPIPANQDALRMYLSDHIDNQEARETLVKLFGTEIVRGVIGYHKYALAPEGDKWNGPAEIAKAEVSDLKKMCAWVDGENPDVKSSYKLPHHKADGYATVWAGVKAAMGVLLGARGGVNVPEEDRKGIYNHLSKHYEDFGKEPPEFKEYSVEELKSMFPEFLPENELTVTDFEGKEVPLFSLLVERIGENLAKSLAAKLDEEIMLSVQVLQQEVDDLKQKTGSLGTLGNDAPKSVTTEVTLDLKNLVSGAVAREVRRIRGRD